MLERAERRVAAMPARIGGQVDARRGATCSTSACRDAGSLRPGVHRPQLAVPARHARSPARGRSRSSPIISRPGGLAGRRRLAAGGRRPRPVRRPDDLRVRADRSRDAASSVTKVDAARHDPTTGGRRPDLDLRGGRAGRPDRPLDPSRRAAAASAADELRGMAAEDAGLESSRPIAGELRPGPAPAGQRSRDPGRAGLSLRRSASAATRRWARDLRAAASRSRVACYTRPRWHPVTRRACLLVEDVPQVAQYIRGLLNAQSAVQAARRPERRDAGAAPDPAAPARTSSSSTPLLQGRVRGCRSPAQIAEAGYGVPVIVLTVPQNPVEVDASAGIHGVLAMPFSGFDLMNRIAAVRKDFDPAVDDRLVARSTRCSRRRAASARRRSPFNLAVAFGQAEQRTVLIDGSLQFGDLRALLKVPGRRARRSSTCRPTGSPSPTSPTSSGATRPGSTSCSPRRASRWPRWSRRATSTRSCRCSAGCTARSSSTCRRRSTTSTWRSSTCRTRSSRSSRTTRRRSTTRWPSPTRSG